MFNLVGGVVLEDHLAAAVPHLQEKFPIAGGVLRFLLDHLLELFVHDLEEDGAVWVQLVSVVRLNYLVDLLSLYLARNRLQIVLLTRPMFFLERLRPILLILLSNLQRLLLMKVNWLFEQLMVRSTHLFKPKNLNINK